MRDWVRCWAVTLALMLALAVFFLGWVAGAEAATWRDVLDVAQSTPVPGGSALWVEKISPTSYRVWMRDGSKVPAGVAWGRTTIRGVAVTITITPPEPGQSFGVHNCDGTMGQHGEGAFAGSPWSGWQAPYLYQTDPAYSGMGRQLAAGNNGAYSQPGVKSPAEVCWVGTFTNSTIQAGARAADSLVQGFDGVTPGTCSWSSLAVLAVGSGNVKMLKTGSPDCVPDGMAIAERFEDGTASFRSLVGDPALAPGAVGGQPQPTHPSNGVGVTAVPGTDFNPDTGKGLGASGGTGAPETSGGPGVGGGSVSGGGAGWQWSGGGGSSGGGPSVADIASGVKQGLDQVKDEAQTDCLGSPCLPGAPTYDTSIPEVPGGTKSIPDLITGFLAGNPVVAAIQGTQLQATGGTCSIAFSSFGHAASLDFCWSGAYLEVVGTMLVSIASIGAVLIAWGAK